MRNHDVERFAAELGKKLNSHDGEGAISDDMNPTRQ